MSPLFILSSSAPVPSDTVHTEGGRPWLPSHHTPSPGKRHRLSKLITNIMISCNKKRLFGVNDIFSYRCWVSAFYSYYKITSYFQYSFCGLIHVWTTLAHLHQCGICCGCLSSEQSWHQEGRARSSCPRCPEPPYRPGYKGQMLRKDLEEREILSFHSAGYFLPASTSARKHLQMPQSSQQSHTFELQFDNPEVTVYCVTETWGCELITFDWNAIAASRRKGKWGRGEMENMRTDHSVHERSQITLQQCISQSNILLHVQCYAIEASAGFHSDKNHQKPEREALN